MQNGSCAESSPSASAGTSRRRVLTLLGAGGAVGLASLFSRDEARAGHDSTNVFHLGETNTATAATSLEASVDAHAFTVEHTHTDDTLAAIRGVNSSAVFGFGVQGESGAGVGVSGHGTGDANGVAGESENGSGVVGLSSGAPAVRGVSFGHVGVQGQTESMVEPAVLGESLVCVERGPCEGDSTGTGVFGRSDAGTGVRGDCPRGTGVEAVSEEGLALDVVGKASFSTAGSGVVPAGANSGFVPAPAVTADSHISVTLASDPGERELRWVERSPGSGFTVHLSSAEKKKRPETALTYLVVEPSSA